MLLNADIAARQLYNRIQKIISVQFTLNGDEAC